MLQDVHTGGVIGPSNSVQYRGSKVTLDCSATTDSADIVEWAEYQTSGLPTRIYVSHKGLVTDHPRYGRYNVTQKTEGAVTFHTLEILAAATDDAGRYGCKRILEDNLFYTAEVAILGEFKHILLYN